MVKHGRRAFGVDEARVYHGRRAFGVDGVRVYHGRLAFGVNVGCGVRAPARPLVACFLAIAGS